ncbi:nuclear transport factor 2 family protein [Novosphingobium profundi]|uniref:nuclear transport factor 2 family protein n=1 Tax=Novosphingobium profundi TaxID=1774954 RepID=UPI001BDB4D41|nr:nuclear transport factor 2 family protein [Novosphingobium profundi]MBT0670733.1 nuclear transport factor 2 family protein [Novosphingobium profundi]
MSQNPITRMFDWWNGAFEGEGFTPEGFAGHFTHDADFIVDGGVRGTGPEGISAHFERIRAKCDHVALVTPVIATLSDAEQGFVQYRCTFTAGEKSGSEVCMARADFREGKIARFEVIGRPENA